MKRQSFITTMAKWMLIAVFVSLMSVTTTWVIVNWHLQQVFQAFPVLAELGQDSLPWGDTIETDADADEKPAAEVDEEVVEGEIAEKGSGRLEQLVNRWLEQEKGGTAFSEIDLEDDSMPVWSGQQENVTVLSMDDLMLMRDELSDEDKMKVFSLAGTKIPFDELQTLSEWVEDGLTMNEIVEIEKMFEQHLNNQEVEQLLQIAESYLE